MSPEVERRVWTPPESPIGTKAGFRELEARGQLGNRLQTWETTGELRESNYQGWLRIANRRADSPFKVHEVVPGTADSVFAGLIGRGADGRDLFFQEIPGPDNPRLINFEAYRNPDYIWMKWGTGQRPLRTDLESPEARISSGLEAVEILKFFLADEYNILQDIWNTYPEAIVEGSCWQRPVGVLHRRLVLWEARQY